MTMYKQALIDTDKQMQSDIGSLELYLMPVEHYKHW